MKPMFALIALFSALTPVPELTAASSAAGESDIIQIIRVGDQAAVRALLQSGAVLNARDSSGNTPLHAAALRGDAATIAALLKSGAEVNATNNAGATPLLYGAHHFGIVRDLLAHGANPNLASALGSTPLMAAVIRNDSFAAVRLLLDHGADIKARRSAESYGLIEGEQALALAIEGGDQRTIDMLIKRGATINPTNSFSPLQSAALFGKLSVARRLLDLGGDPNRNADQDKAGHTLNSALFGDHRQVAALLIAHGADLRLPAPMGHGTPPMVFSAYNESGDPAIAHLLISRGLDVNAANEAGETALSWALKRGPEVPLVKVLREAGATNAGPVARRRETPARAIPSSSEARPEIVRDFAQRAIRALERSSTVFIDSALAQKQGQCISCHQQALPAAVIGLARERGLQISEADVVHLLEAHRRSWGASAEAARQLLEPQADAANNLGWGLQGLHALRYSPDEVTEAMVHYLLAVQRTDGSWRTYDRRPPIQDGPLVGTALAVHGLQLYPPPGRERESQRSLELARGWLTRAKPQTHNERIFQLLGLSWSGKPTARLEKYVKRILAEQRQDGGWAQLPGREGDAWATGQALVALHQAGGVASSHPAYQRGLEFLLRTQFDDGSWLVRTRTWPFQPHFDSQFPHGKDQWISAAGTAWATMALLLTIEPTASKDAFPSAQQLIASTESKAPAPLNRASDPKLVSGSADVDFNRDIRPIFEKSCLNCHSGEKPKGGFDLSTLDGAMKGGQSGEAAIISGQAERSPLLRLVQDQVEDLEMPPLAKRSKYPALTKDQVGTLRGWIDQGALWPKGTVLKGMENETANGKQNHSARFAQFIRRLFPVVAP